MEFVFIILIQILSKQLTVGPLFGKTHLTFSLIEINLRNPEYVWTDVSVRYPTVGRQSWGSRPLKDWAGGRMGVVDGS